MSLKALAPYVAKFSLVGGLVLTVLVLGVGSVAGVPLPLVALALCVGSLMVGPAMFATTDSGLDSAEAGVAGGFDVTNPSAYRASDMLPGRIESGFVFIGAIGWAAIAYVLVA
ncbi:hypothetical protein [Haloarchaeobius sp. TZWWS8]|uniref:hypothetical protein n=1 Tax=Haloarchaeobius sp. TZWWS8 TaxID=3446121 RepID=UPI003EB887A9